MDYNSWDQEESKHNDEWFNTDKFRNQIIGGKVTSISISKSNDLFVEMDNGVRIEFPMLIRIMKRNVNNGFYLNIQRIIQEEY